MAEKKSELSVIKWPRNQMLNVVTTFKQRCGNVLTTSDNDVVTTSETDVATTLIFDCATTLWQCLPRCCQNVAVPVGHLRQSYFDKQWCRSEVSVFDYKKNLLYLLTPVSLNLPKLVYLTNPSLKSLKVFFQGFLVWSTRKSPLDVF